MPGVFVDREAEAATLAAFLERVASDGPRIAVVYGVAGVGKTSLLAAFVQRVRAVRPVRVGSIASVRCHGQVGEENAYGVMVDALKELRPRGKRGRLFKLGRRVVVDSGVELVANLVPAAGPALRAGVAAAAKSPGEGGKGVAIPVPMMVADAILDAVRSQRPSALLIDDAHLIDASSCLVLDRLLASAADRPLAIVLAVRSGELAVDSPLRELLDRLAIQGSALTLSLTGFGIEAVNMFVRERYGRDLGAERISALHRHTGGHPIFVAQYLSMLSERPGRLPGGDVVPVTTSTGEAPTSAEAVIRQRIRRLADSDVELLSFGAIQGERFITAAVQRLSGRPRKEVLDRLYEISITSGLIQVSDADEWARRAGCDVYEFEHALVRQVLYVKQSPQLRRERHAAVAAVLSELMRDWPTKPRTYSLEVIHQHHLGYELVPAASKALAMARSLIGSGGSLVEAERLCRQALEDIRQENKDREAAGLLVEIIELLLLSTERHWSTGPAFLATTPLEPLVDEAGAAADRSGDLRLRCRAAALRGRVLHKVRGVDESLNALSDAVRLADQAEDTAMRFLTRSAYGRELTKRDLRAGLEVLLEVEGLMRRHELGRTNDPALLHAAARIEMQVGVSLFDSGDLGAALARLESCVERLRQGGDAGTMPTALNYLAQVQCAVGLWGKARATLVEAVALGEGEPSAWHAYNVALLGKLHLEQGELETAVNALEVAWEETRRTFLINVASLVCNLYVEVLLAVSRGDPGETSRVQDLLTSNIEQCRRAGLRRSEVVALSLLARLHLALGEQASAVRAGEEAVRILDEHGPLPAVCGEEIRYWHSVVLDRSGRAPEAERLRSGARRIVEEKGATLPGDLRHAFFTEVKLNVVLLADRRSTPA
ncbi:ATP-binding protein [Amycolatopsis sp. H20-H5]|uniref:ATP-binding protein n=1 Tax=Amycolatopsis sp. H20-H5 TaxID=3046309 RepID=UPI002DB6753A|nr:AAA family ATPase [Amycolatopsis sp. H20-H5]MEC3981440.1 AAA family ATPase [Amycolatopsis sp. H20-H5]